MFELLILLTQRMTIIITLAFILTRTPVFKKIADLRINTRTKIVLSIIFGAFGILGTYTGIPVNSSQSYLLWVPNVDRIYFDYALANLRSVGVIVGGLLGGPFVGFGAGLIAGCHRFFLGGFTAIACGISPIIEGLIAGYVSRKSVTGRTVSTLVAFLTGLSMTMIHLVLIIILSQPTQKAFDLVSLIAFPMLFANSVGTSLFILAIQSVIHQEDRIESRQAQRILRITDMMLLNLRQGLNHNSAHELLKIIYKETKVAAISITDKERILAHIGIGSDHHIPGNNILTKATEDVLQSGKLAIVKSKEEIDCNYPNCPLISAIICPLIKHNTLVGVLKFYYLNPKQIKSSDIELVEGLGKLLSHQLEVAEAEKQAKLISAAEIKALQAQINPHFLFNSMNTIIALIRTNPDIARDLLLNLSLFFRQNINATQCELIRLEQEIKHTKAYLGIEEVRFGHRLKIIWEVEPWLRDVLIPPLTLQPLVENSIRHGLNNISSDGILKISVRRISDYTLVSVEDNGVGIPVSKIPKLFAPKADANSKSLGLNNVNQRLIGFFGDKAGLKISNAPEGGTIVTFILPMERGEYNAN